jgi:hypothetical protein
MARGSIKKVPAMRPMKLLHGTYPPSPDIKKTGSIKPAPAATREYGKEPPLAGDTALTGET